MSLKNLCWTEADVRCPFYISDSREKRSLSCEGFGDDCGIQLRFRRLELREKHMGAFCVNRYSQCPVYKCVYESKYREDGG